MRIAYGVHGYGRGHSSRALAVLPELTARHEVLVLASDDAYRALAGDYDVFRLPGLRYVLDENGQRRPLPTIWRGTQVFFDARTQGPAERLICQRLEEFAPDVIVSDSETFTHWAGRHMGVPRVTFDHFGVLVYCNWPMTGRQKLTAAAEAWFYRRYMAGEPQRKVIASFYDAPPKRPGVRVVGPVLREIVHHVRPAEGDYLLVYFSNGQRHYTPAVEKALRALDTPVVIYGVGRAGTDGRLDYRPPSNTKFVEDLAAARAVFSTAGNQLISEAVHLQKPLLLLPEDGLEQHLNAQAIAKMGIGEGLDGHRVTADRLRGFLDRAEDYRGHFPPQRDGRAEAVAAIEEFAVELTAPAGR